MLFRQACMDAAEIGNWPWKRDVLCGWIINPSSFSLCLCLLPFNYRICTINIWNILPCPITLDLAPGLALANEVVLSMMQAGVKGSLCAGACSFVPLLLTWKETPWRNIVPSSTARNEYRWNSSAVLIKEDLPSSHHMDKKWMFLMGLVNVALFFNRWLTHFLSMQLLRRAT